MCKTDKEEVKTSGIAAASLCEKMYERDGDRHEDDNGGNVYILGSSSSADQYDLSFPNVKTETWHFKQEVDQANSEIPSASERIGEPCPITFPKIKTEIKSEVEENDIDNIGDLQAHNEPEERIKDEDKEKIFIEEHDLSDPTSDAIIDTQSSGEPFWNGGASCKWQTSGSSESTSSHHGFVEEFEMKNDLNNDAHIQKDNYLSCAVCQALFPDEEMLNVHSCRCSVETSPLYSTQSIKMDKCIHPCEKPFPCSLCNARFSHKSLVAHIRTHTGEKPFSCSVCSAKFSNKSNLTTHIRTHTGEKPFSCSVCSFKSSTESQLNVHIRMHTGEKPFKCSVCGFKFSYKSTLAVHLRTHTGEKPFSCSLCNARFSQKINLVNHIRTHTGEKPFPCSLCNAWFSQKNSLVTHIRTHTGEKPFSCSMCSYTFSRKDCLENHIRTHTGEKPFSCSVCSAKFSNKSTSRYHIGTHTGQKPFSCSKHN